MKKCLLTLLTLMSLVAAKAQWMADSVLMGTASINDVFYSLQNGTVKTENNKNWHLAFSMLSAPDSAAVWGNHNSGAAFVTVYNIHKDASQWASVTLADTASATLQFNNDQRWTQGALNANASAPTQYGWGHYSGPPNHDVVGDSIYLIKSNGVFYEFMINSLVGVGADAGNWNIQIGDLAGNTVYDTIRYANYTNRHFAYYDLVNKADTNREPAITTWDLVFNRYTTNDPLSGPNPFNAVVGALSNKGIKVSKANVVHVDTAFAHYGTYVWPWPADSAVISTVGYNWKTFTPPFTWSVPDSVSYFIQDLSGNLYQLQFTGYSGSGAGKIYLRKRLVVATAVQDVQANLLQYELFPNPAADELNLMMQMKAADEVHVSIVNMQGQQVFTQSYKTLAGYNTLQISSHEWPAGLYNLSVESRQVHLHTTVTVVH